MNNDVSDIFMHVFWFQSLELPLKLYLGLVSMQWKIHNWKLLMAVFLSYCQFLFSAAMYENGSFYITLQLQPFW